MGQWKAVRKLSEIKYSIYELQAILIGQENERKERSEVLSTLTSFVVDELKAFDLIMDSFFSSFSFKILIVRGFSIFEG